MQIREAKVENLRFSSFLFCFLLSLPFLIFNLYLRKNAIPSVEFSLSHLTPEDVKYLILLEKRGQEEFLIGDCYPCVITGDIKNIHLYDFFPISSERIIILASRGVESLHSSVRTFNKSNLKQPIIKGDKVTIKVTNIYQNEIKYINQIIINNSKIGVAFKNYKNISVLPINFI